MTDLERLAAAVEHQAFALDRLALAIERLLDAGEGDQRPRAARVVPPGQPWYFRNHRTMAQVIEAGE